MRDGKRFDEDIVQLKTVAGLEQPPIEAPFGIAAVEAVEGGSFVLAPFGFERPESGFLRGAIAIDREFQFFRQREQAANVVAVLVGDEDAGEIFGGASDGGEAVADLTCAESRVHEDAGFVGFDVGAVAGGTAAENGEANSHG